MQLVKRKKSYIIAVCENCNNELQIPYTNTINPHMRSIDLKDVVQCPCGEYHNLIIEPENKTKIQRTQPKNTDFQSLKCPRCEATQIHSGDKGFSIGKAVAGNFLFGPVGLLGGFLGSKNIMITCLKCGYKWQAGKI